MGAMRFDLQVEMEDGETYAVTADQRDVARWEMSDLYSVPLRRLSMVRYLAWAASVRQKLTKLTWEKFQDRAVEVTDVKPEAEPLDPGQPDPRTESSSKSSGGPAAE